MKQLCGAVPLEAIRVMPRLFTINEDCFERTYLIKEGERENSFAGLLATWAGWPSVAGPTNVPQKPAKCQEKAKSGSLEMSNCICPEIRPRPRLRTPLANNESDDHSTDGTQDKDWCVGFGDDGVWQA